MPMRDLLLLAGVCLAWGFNFAVTKWALSGWGGAFEGAPAFFFAFLRFLGVLLILAPFFLRRIPPRFGWVLAYGVCLGALHFGFLFSALKVTNPTTVAVVFPIYVPMTTALSVLFLGEVVRWRRGFGIAMAVLGVVVIGAGGGDSVAMGLGVVLVLGAALFAAVGSVLNRRIGADLGAFEAQAWVAVISLLPLGALTFFFESGQWAALQEGGWRLWLSILYIVVPVSIVGHGVFYGLLTRNPATVVTPLSLMAPVLGVVFGVTLVGDALTMNMIIGGAVVIAGAALVASRPARRAAVTPTSPAASGSDAGAGAPPQEIAR